MRYVLGIFVGGRSERMGGKPKGKMQAPDTGEPIVDKLWRLGTELGLEVVLVGDASEYENHARGCPRLQDDPAGVGPLGGFAALFNYAGDRHSIAIACDMPNVGERELLYLMSLDDEPEAWVARLADDAPHDPFYARYRSRDVLRKLRPALEAGTHSMQRFFDTLSPRTFVPDPSVLKDWDSPEDAS